MKTQTGPNLADLQLAEGKLLVQTYERNPLLFVTGHDVFLTDEHGEDYLDLLSGIGCSALGYRHPAMEKAIVEQGTRLLHTSNLFYTEHTAALALRLTEISGMDRVFLCNSGTETWEAALKLARANAELVRAQGKPMGTRFLALEHSFHGRSMGSVSTTHKAKYREPFNPLVPGVEFVALNDVAALRAGFSDEVCAILIETVQGEGGIHPVSNEFFTAARELCDSTGALLVADEIQCGLGRTGKWFAYQHLDILPDVVTVAKPLAGGIPIGAMLCTEAAAKAFTPGMHGTTFGGNPFACAVAIAVLDAIRQEGVLANVTEVGGYFKERLLALGAKHDAIKEVRALGLMIGVEFHSTQVATEIAAAMMQKRILLNRTSENVLRFLPPFILKREHVDLAVAALDALLSRNTEGHAMTELAGAANHA